MSPATSAERDTFEVLIPRAKVSANDIDNLVGPLWLPTLAALYLRAGLYMPDGAKKSGCYFGFCDDQGRYLPAHHDLATHFGWSAEPVAPYGAKP